MNKTALAERYSNTAEQKILLCHLLDLYERSNDKNIITVSNFMSESDSLTAKRMLSSIPACNFFIFGGYDEGERACAVFLPDYLSEDDIIRSPEIAEICYLDISVGTYNRQLANFTHRDCLGSLMALGIEREMIGDIIAAGSQAVIVIKSGISDYILENLTKIGRYPVTVTVLEKCGIKPIDDFDRLSGTVQSMRLDAVLSEIFGLSRSASCDMISGRAVTVSGGIALKPDLEIKAGDRISFRGKGKAIIEAVDGTTKKGRIKFSYKKSR